MFFLYKKWDWFCKKLSEYGIKSIPAKQLGETTEKFLVLKHDVETDVAKAYRMAKIETTYGHCGSYYVQAYLMNEPKNIEMLHQMQAMGHEISYHYDVMDSTKGNLALAIDEFEKNCEIFKKNGFEIITVCQHGNPVIERVGYTSNRDFFRDERVCKQYPNVSDIMVNFKKKYDIDYMYYSDAGRKFKFIFDPINNDIIPSDEKNIPYENMTALFAAIVENNRVIISTHPHRWSNSAVLYALKHGIFKMVKTMAKVLIKIPVMKKFMSKYYYLAKKM